ncbi:phosphoribosyl-ATP pyrophosphohydrolase [Halalkalibacillus sediminis]|uniref:Phosphoribosyl-ATP pyrophosphohydrolase n=1 Tax=Halalkalibacillus sediminis TaxID=2018042 RepID=A0A2I0QRV9_9BACI|nr:nucleoside triphosphate pyrophosphohydrolase [Halalkalibacillus sediminis]PKR76810.1 phosphoribosyl-ATP pyrophosphohydrolase [Halalkalibacillus sediminis]
MPTYNKLIRDKIPEIIDSTGSSFNTRTLNEKEYIQELKKKLNEEVEEYQEAKTSPEALEELADILELLHALSKVHGSSIDTVEKVRCEKAQEKGAFEKRIFLENVED